MGYYTNISVEVNLDLGDLAKRIAQDGESVARDLILYIDEEVGSYSFSAGLVLDLIKVLKEDRPFHHDHLWERFVDNVRKEITT